MSILRHARPKVKATRKTLHPAEPFGFGLLRTPYVHSENFSAADRDWAAAAFAPESEVMPDWAWDALAYERTLEDAYLASVGADNRCSICGLPDEEPLRGGHCGPCRMQVLADEREWQADVDNGGLCADCGLWSDFRSSDDRCPPCQLM